MFSIVLVPRAHEREKERDFEGFHLLRQWSFEPHKDHILLLTPTAAVRDVRGEMRLGGGLGEEPVIGDQRTSGNNEEFSFVSSSNETEMLKSE